MVSRSLCLGAHHGPLTCERQLHMCAGLDRTQTNSNSVFRVMKNTRFLIPDHWTLKTKERQCLNHSSHIICVVGVCSGTREARCASVVTTGPNMISILRAITPIQLGFHHPRREYTRLHKRPILRNHCLFTCCGTSIEKVRISGFQLGTRQFFQDSRHAS